jgi:hypothetical protein
LVMDERWKSLFGNHIQGLSSLHRKQSQDLHST